MPQKRPFSSVPGLSWRPLLVALTLCNVAMASGCSAVPSGSSAAPASAANLLSHLWQEDLTGGVELWGARGIELAEATVLDAAVVIVGSKSGSVRAFDAGTGELRWTHAGSEPVVAPVRVEGRMAIVGDATGAVYALNVSNGEEIWRFDTGGPIEASVAISDGKVVVANALNRVFALNLVDGTFLWRKERDKVNDFTMFGHAAPTIADGRVVVGTSDGNVMTYDLRDGATVWGRDLSKGRRRFRDVDANIVVADTRVYAASFAGGLYALDAESGEIVWHRDIEGVKGIEFVEGTLYFTSRDGIHAARPMDGGDMWYHRLDEDDAASAPRIGTRNLYVSLRRRGLLTLDRRRGSMLALVDMGSGFSAKPTLSMQRIFVLSNAGQFYAFVVDDTPLSLF